MKLWKKRSVFVMNVSKPLVVSGITKHVMVASADMRVCNQYGNLCTPRLDKNFHDQNFWADTSHLWTAFIIIDVPLLGGHLPLMDNFQSDCRCP